MSTPETPVAENAEPDTDEPLTTEAQNTEAENAEPQAAEYQKTFADYGVQPQIVTALEKIGITHPFPIQASTLTVALSGHDIIGQAKTGTGKTLGFGIPVLQQVVGPGEPGFEELEAPGKPQALVVVPTRELAVQVASDLTKAAKERSLRVLVLYGGRAYEPQIDALRKGIEVVVSTPGRLIDLANQKHITLGHVRHVVLDEADEMLDLGFLPDVEKILAQTPAGRQTMLFSATMPGAIVGLARKYMTQPTHIRASEPDDTGATVAATTQYVYRCHNLDKVEVLARILQSKGRGLTIVFSRTKRTAAKVADELIERGFAAASIHGDLGQGAREQALRAFRNGKVDVLVATDVAARGIDVEDVTHVINYGCPEDEKTYLHRIGRTGRAGNTGIAVTFVDWDDLHRWAMIDKALSLGIPEVAETYSTSPHLYTDLDIPEGTKGTLPRSKRTREGLDAEVVEDLGETGGKRKAATSTSGGRGRDRDRDRDRDKPRDGDGERPARRRTRGGDADEAGAQPVVAAETEDASGEERPRRSRTRRRTRGGKTVDGVESGVTVGDDAPAAIEGDAPVASSDAGEGDADSAPRRRRRRGGRGRGGRAGDATGGEGGDSGDAAPVRSEESASLVG